MSRRCSGPSKSSCLASAHLSSPLSEPGGASWRLGLAASFPRPLSGTAAGNSSQQIHRPPQGTTNRWGSNQRGPWHPQFCCSAEFRLQLIAPSCSLPLLCSTSRLDRLTGEIRGSNLLVLCWISDMQRMSITSESLSLYIILVYSPLVKLINSAASIILELQKTRDG
jgi:hypothetical protein